MTARMQRLWRIFSRRRGAEPEATASPVSTARPQHASTLALDIGPTDPLAAYFQHSTGAVDIQKLELQSPALEALKAAGVQMAVPLVSQGELIGLLNLGPRLSEQEYSADDRTLLNNLATQAAPALRVAQLVREQQMEVRVRERIEQEMRVARLIQQTLLPKQVPALPGWEIAAQYQPARAVGGDFYDFLELPDGRLGLIIGDVTDKGVPAALVMATTRSILRAAATRLATPGQVLERANDILVDDIPPNMFVTCLYAILDPANGRLHFANAGHDLPYRRHDGTASELRARGMPLGLMPGMAYEEKEIVLAPGESVLLYTDGLVEAHNAAGAMFGFPRLRELVAEHPAFGDTPVIDFLLHQLEHFTGPNWEQEDDITLVTIRRAASMPSLGADGRGTLDAADQPATITADNTWRMLAAWNVPSEPGNERMVIDQVADVVAELNVPSRRLEQLKTAVAEATLNAMEHGNHYRPELSVLIEVLTSQAALAVRITDQGGKEPIPDPAAPDLDAKLAGLQSPRGWGLFLIKNLVDEMNVTSGETHHTIELILHTQGDQHAGETL